MAEMIYGPYKTSDTKWTFYYTIEVVSHEDDGYNVRVALYLGAAYTNESDRYWEGAKWNFPISFHQVDNWDETNRNYDIQYRGSQYKLPLYTASSGINSCRKFAEKTFWVPVVDNTETSIFESINNVAIDIWMEEEEGNTEKPHSIPYCGTTLTLPPRRTRNLIVNYNCNGADKILLSGKEQATNYIHQETYIYGTYYSDGLDNGNNLEHLYCEKEDYSMTGNWNLQSGDDINNLYSVSWSGGFYPEDFAYDWFGIDLSTYGDLTVTVYLEWKKNRNYTAHMKIDGEWKTGRAYMKTDDGWKEIMTVKQF